MVLDFDGTIADAEEVMIRVYKPLAEKHGWPELTRKDYYQLRKARPREVMRWANIKIWQLPKLLRLGRIEYKKHADEIKLFSGMSEAIEKLAKNYDVYILSSNDHDTLSRILKNNKMSSPATILQGSPLFGKDKALKKLLKSNKYAAKDAWMIGDEVRDIEAGKKARMNTIGVTWGLQSAEGLKKAAPDKIVRKPEDIVKIILN